MIKVTFCVDFILILFWRKKEVNQNKFTLLIYKWRIDFIYTIYSANFFCQRNLIQYLTFSKSWATIFLKIKANFIPINADPSIFIKGFSNILTHSNSSIYAFRLFWTCTFVYWSKMYECYILFFCLTSHELNIPCARHQ